MPTKLSQILKPLLTGKRHSPPYTDHDPSWLCGKWKEYLTRYYGSTPKEGIAFIDKMLVEGKSLGQTSCQLRGCKTASIEPRPLKMIEVETLRIIRKGFIDETTKGKRESLPLNQIIGEGPPHKRIKTTTSDLVSLLDFNLDNITHTSDEEEVELHPPHKELDGAMLAKLNAHKEQIKKKEQRMTNELSKQKTPSGPWAIKLPPKTKAEQLLEKKGRYEEGLPHASNANIQTCRKS